MTDENPMSRATTEPSYFDALIPLITLTVLIGGSVFLFGSAAVDGPMQVALVLCCAVVAVILLRKGHPWDDIVKSGQHALQSIVTPIFILLAIGALIGTWNLSGTIPTLAFYGIQILQPKFMYVATALICGVISLGIGSSWTTAGTIGVGLIGIANLIGVSPAITAGAVISGSYLGDKLSPLSETTVLTAQLADVDVGTHIRAMLWTAGPAFLIAAVSFTILGFRERGYSGPQIESELSRLDQVFWITPLNLIPLAVLVALSIKKVPASLAILSSALLAGLLAVVFQPHAVLRFVNEPALPTAVAYVKGVWSALANGFRIDSGMPEVDSLLTRGGMSRMLNTIWIVIGAVTFGTLLDDFNMIAKLVNPLLARATTVGRLILAVVSTAIGLNIITADQYIALVLPVRMFRLEFRRRGLKAQNLSRACADAGTVTSPLVPWNSCGAFMAVTLGVPTLVYLPFCIFNIASPLMSLFWGFTGWKIVHSESGPLQADERMKPASPSP
jgi:NhaC family Na+:H+ antiporter